MIRERVMLGLDYAQRCGTKSGRAVGRPRAVFDRGEISVPSVNLSPPRSIFRLKLCPSLDLLY
jgi:hypothetical protein